jgi:uncharacterized protein YndB with AHSA1/START domain
MKNVKITVQTTVNASVTKVWDYFTDPKHIVHWNHASADWRTSRAENDLRVGGKFLSRMEARDGSVGFDFIGIYDTVENCKEIRYTLEDERTVQVIFEQTEANTIVTETFDAEHENTPELQQAGWQAILDNFKKHVETSGIMETMHFGITINAAVEKVYDLMISDSSYREWTSEFNPTSHFIGSWVKGSKIIFVGTDQDGKTGGMVSRIKDNIPNTFISIEHLGLFQDGKEITSGSEVEGWAGANENYTFTANEGKTLLSVELDANQDFMTYFNETWPKALDKLKEICER